MKTKSYYICEDCNSTYLTANEAEECELNHAKIKANTRIIKYIHFNCYLEHKFIPDRLIVDLGDGKQHIYQLWRKGQDD